MNLKVEGGGKMVKKSNKGVDEGTQFSPWVKKEEAEKIKKALEEVGGKVELK